MPQPSSESRLMRSFAPSGGHVDEIRAGASGAGDSRLRIARGRWHHGREVAAVRGADAEEADVFQINGVVAA